MSSFKKAQKAQRRTHQERAQPARRRKLGILEKGKDWKQRRDDFHRKETRLKALYEKARNRNPDEFYHAMASSKTKDGVHVALREGQQYTADEMKLLKTQDLKYLKFQLTQERRHIERTAQALPLLGGDGGASDVDDGGSDAETKGEHTLFVESRRELDKFDAAEYFDTDPSLVDRKHNRPRKSMLEDGSAIVGGGAARRNRKKIERQRAAAVAELDQRVKRVSKLEAVERELETKQNLAGKGKRTKIPAGASNAGGIPVYKWRKERKR